MNPQVREEVITRFNGGVRPCRGCNTQILKDGGCVWISDPWFLVSGDTAIARASGSKMSCFTDDQILSMMESDRLNSSDVIHEIAIVLEALGA
jgi:hypothetical protein